MDALEVRSRTCAAHAFAGIDGEWRFDLDHVGAPVGELTHRRRARAYPRQI